ncbi:MAG: GGDEF domain-containing protein [Desulfobacterales bacterium]|nr:GGDEF domain-containing protein [Desulfobacterales bacterium]
MRLLLPYSPFVLEDRTVCIIGLANKAGGFTGHDAYLARVFGNLAAISLRNSGRLEKLRELSRSDVLTGCFNRRGGVGCLDHELSRIGRTGTALAVIMFDIDEFKAVNDFYGHDTGDQVLQEIAEVATKNMREADILIRWGGEEFLVVAPDTDMESAAVLAERLRKTIAGNKFSGPGKITASFGIAQYQKGDRRDSLIDRADRYMYLAKQKGRNRVEPV